MSINRTREHESDRKGAEVCGNSMWLASTLNRLVQLTGRIDNFSAETHPANAHMLIVNPLHMKTYDSLFATHPPLEKRIAALQDM